MNEVKIPYEVFKQAERAETRSRAEYVRSNEVLENSLRKIKPKGGHYGKKK